jgi:hypothetical protein
MAGNLRTPPTSDTLTVTKYRTNEQIVGIVEQALIACQARSTNNAGHNHGGNCGEPMAALAIIRTSSAASLKGAKVVTWRRFKDRNNGNNAWVTGVMNPCGGGFGLDDMGPRV